MLSLSQSKIYYYQQVIGVATEPITGTTIGHVAATSGVIGALVATGDVHFYLP